MYTSTCLLSFYVWFCMFLCFVLLFFPIASYILLLIMFSYYNIVCVRLSLQIKRLLTYLLTYLLPICFQLHPKLTVRISFFNHHFKVFVLLIALLFCGLVVSTVVYRQCCHYFFSRCVQGGSIFFILAGTARCPGQFCQVIMFDLDRESNLWFCSTS